ncbi:MAG: HupE/UreJ family protein [Verrucomicrobia bacterium]|nr:HupE/UreJ family protein [Verrucomicrobiota bacterium]
MFLFKRARFTALALALSALTAAAHPIPDLPVRAWFEPGGAAILRVEVDPRCFEKDPTGTPYFQNAVLQQMSAKDKEEFKAQARELVRRSVEFRFEPLGRSDPEFEYTFTTHAGAPLAKADDPVMISGEWRTRLPKGLEGYKIKALDGGSFSVLFLNHINGQALERINVLFPGETSFLLDLTGVTSGAPTQPVPGSVGLGSAGGRGATFMDFLREGFLHVLPRGLDHILFVLGLFLLAREWRPVLWQVTMFTLAHTLTLCLATLRLVSVPASVVEPIIAGSIAVVALENIFRPKYTPWRLVVVFVFGLVHGLGFAGALSALELPRASLVAGLLGFNVGVELGQLAVITLAFAATFWLKDAARYRKWVVVPGSAVIALLGVWWMFQRIVGS